MNQVELGVTTGYGPLDAEKNGQFNSWEAYVKERLTGARYFKGLDCMRFYAKMGWDDVYRDRINGQLRLAVRWVFQQFYTTILLRTRVET
jgi:hypothetical protein